ncbi:hypothetical protein B0A55_05771 [Friedmanniomyces simplex]|uniref:Uncharacterized protein n=1 Tax=Friedmanniomyces simplex TaxID=329884 RepID=A0A4U0XD07_9PEZI|nr:hypothetical protein B0A55_05771 [Friedmanniomyces simplex]
MITGVLSGPGCSIDDETAAEDAMDYEEWDMIRIENDRMFRRLIRGIISPFPEIRAVAQWARQLYGMRLDRRAFVFAMWNKQRWYKWQMKVNKLEAREASELEEDLQYMSSERAWDAHYARMRTLKRKVAAIWRAAAEEESVITQIRQQAWEDAQSDTTERGKISLPLAENLYISLTAVYFDSQEEFAGQHHKHPYGEINCVVPIDPTFELEGLPVGENWQGAGWTSLGPGTHH